MARYAHEHRKFFIKQQEKGTKRREQKKGITNMATPHGHHQRKKSFLPSFLALFFFDTFGSTID